MSFTRLGARIARRHPFTTRYASNLPILFGVVYFAQGMRVRQEADAAEVRHAPTLPRDGGMSTTGFQFYPWEVEQCYRCKAR